MCGRYSLTAEEAKLRKRFGYQEELKLLPRYNIAPTQEAIVIIAEDTPHPCMMRWGLIPFWAKDETIGNKLINARSETLSEKPAFRASFTRRRCLVLTDGFYEWAKDGASKQPVRILMADREPFAFAGLWDRWRRLDETELRTFTIVTTEANELLQSVHTRMPVIVDASDYARWLDPTITKPDDLRPMLRPYTPEAMEFYPVDRVVNLAKHDSPACIAPVPESRKAGAPKVGQLVRVHHCEHAYSLPDGLEPGTTVRLLSWHSGGWVVETGGREWSISMTNVEAGLEYYVAGEWVHESHPRAVQERQRLQKWARSGKGYQGGNGVCEAPCAT